MEWKVSLFAARHHLFHSRTRHFSNGRLSGVENGRISALRSHQYSRTEILSMPAPAMVPIREAKTHSILLADDLTLVREGLAALCQARPQFTVIAQCSEGAAALRFIEERQPDLAVLDLNLPDLFALEIVRRVRQAGRVTKMVVLSTRRDRKTV